VVALPPDERRDRAKVNEPVRKGGDCFIMTITYYVALPFLRADDGSTVPGEAVECPNAATAILRAEILSQGAGNVGAIAFSRTGDPDVRGRGVAQDVR
jgi:hypothetical protein